MLHTCTPTPKGARPRADVIRDADVAREHVAAPAVVVARHHHHGEPGIAKVHQRSQHTHGAARYHGAPLEPELEEIAVDHQGGGVPGKVAHERDERSLHRFRCMAEMDVRDYIAGGREHRHILLGTLQ